MTSRVDLRGDSGSSEAVPVVIGRVRSRIGYVIGQAFDRHLRCRLRAGQSEIAPVDLSLFTASMLGLGSRFLLGLVGNLAASFTSIFA